MMRDPLSMDASAGLRLSAAAVLACVLWLLVRWALA
jgi:hypothetical protein